MADEQKKIERIERLIAMTATENLEEGRAFAYQACRLIREGKFKIVLADASPTSPRGDFRPVSPTYKRPPTPAGAPARPRDSMQDLWDALQGEVIGRDFGGRR